MRNIDAGDLYLSLRQVNGGYNRCTDTEHQRHSRIDEKKRSRNVDGSQGVTADTFSHKNAVGNDEDGRENHSQHRRDK